MSGRGKAQDTEFHLIVKIKDLVKHTFTLTSSNRFPKKYRFTLVNRMQDKVMAIYECVLEANECDLRDTEERGERERLQRHALTYCNELLFFIELAHEMQLITFSSCEYWSKLALDVKYMTAKWRKREKQSNE